MIQSMDCSSCVVSVKQIVAPLPRARGPVLRETLGSRACPSDRGMAANLTFVLVRFLRQLSG